MCISTIINRSKMKSYILYRSLQTLILIIRNYMFIINDEYAPSLLSNEALFPKF